MYNEMEVMEAIVLMCFAVSWIFFGGGGLWVLRILLCRFLSF
jgi:hypothetical protein